MAFKKDEVEIIAPRQIFVGKKDASVTLMEFGEYENEECAKVNEVVKQLLEEFEGKIRFQFRHFPLTLIHQRSLKASESAVAAAQEGKFWEMHNVLFNNRRNLGTTSLKLYSKEAGVKNKKFLDDLVNGVYGWQVQDDLKEGINRGVKELPTFFINDIPVSGKPTYANLSTAIQNALKKKPKPAAKVTFKPAAKPVPKAEVKPAAKVASKPAVKPAAKPVVKAVTKSVAKPAAKPVAKAKAKPAAKKQRA
jgi:predicted DsbA family dithiol-disulfide isomerase